jgi:sodium-dependent dicarboxylate transporter 2/3/5
MLPVGSPTQTIVFGTGHVPMRDMLRAGIWFDVLGIVLILAVFALLGGIDPSVVPSWAR